MSPAPRVGHDNKETRAFLLGMLWAAHIAHAGYGEDTLAAEILRSCGGWQRMQRLARAEDITFDRGFWAGMRDDEKRRTR